MTEAEYSRKNLGGGGDLVFRNKKSSLTIINECSENKHLQHLPVENVFDCCDITASNQLIMEFTILLINNLKKNHKRKTITQVPHSPQSTRRGVIPASS